MSESEHASSLMSEMINQTSDCVKNYLNSHIPEDSRSVGVSAALIAVDIFAQKTAEPYKSKASQIIENLCKQLDDIDRKEPK